MHSTEIIDQEWERMLSFAAQHILRNEDPQSFIETMKLAYLVFPNVFPEEAPEQAKKSLGVKFAYNIWNAMPLPSNHYKPKPLPKPQRNLPCPCGSGVKFKHCCAQLPDLPPLPPEQGWMLLLSELKPKDITNIVQQGLIPKHLIGEAAHILLFELNKPKLAMDMLERLFSHPEKVDERHETALDVLFDCYNELGYTRKKIVKMDKLIATLKPPLRGKVWERYASIFADQQDYDKAWEAFKQAQIDDPDSLSLSALEVTLLMSEHKTEQASERARFWLAKLRRAGFPEDSPQCQFLKQVQDDPNQALVGYNLNAEPEHPRRLYRLLQGLNDVDILPYQIQRDRDDAQELNMLVPPDAITTIESKWHDIWSQDKPFSINPEPFDTVDVWQADIAEKWISFLEAHPLALNSFSVLDDLLMGLQQLEYVDASWIQDSLMAPLLFRSKLILDATFEHNGFAELPWLVVDNRPALRLLVELIEYTVAIEQPHAERQMLEFLLQVNPNDNHGYRLHLSNIYLHEGLNQEILELASHYPDDMHPDLLYDKVVAYYRLGNAKSAMAALKQAKEKFPYVYQYLTAKQKPRKPHIDAMGVRYGGEDQAWIYFDSRKSIWKSTKGLLDFARKI